LLCGFAASPNQLFAARTFAGFGAGAINALVQIAIADVTTLEQRGYYFGMVGVATALGNGLGPLVGGTLTQKAGWPWAFWFVCPLCALAVAYLSSVWPATAAASLSGSSDPSNGSAWDRLKLVDWTGALASLVGIAMILVSRIL
jgi:MFS family permease